MDAIERMEHYATIAGDANSTVKSALISLRHVQNCIPASDTIALRYIRITIWDLERFVRESDARVDTMRKEEAA